MRYVVVAGLLACSFAVAGCGGDEAGDDSADTPAAAEETTTTTATVDTEDGGETPTAATEAIQQAVEACKQSVQTAPVSADVKGDLEDLCEKAASGDEQAVREASREVCVKIVEESVPEGPGREQALAACKTATP